MKAIRIEAFGGPEVLRLVDVPDPSAGPGPDRGPGGGGRRQLHRRLPPHRPLPEPAAARPGHGGRGRRRRPWGRASPASARATASPGRTCLGSYAERVLLPADRAVAVPPGLRRRHGRGRLMLQGMTAHYLCTSTYPLKPGDTCLVHAAAGGVGLLLVQMAKRRGARVIGTVGHRGEGRARARGGRRRGRSSTRRRTSSRR